MTHLRTPVFLSHLKAGVDFFLFGLFFFRQNYLFACFFGVKPAPASEPAPKHDERVMPQDEPDSLYLLCA
jgi:hypothetical protein